jgi:hypothetical protein
MPTLRGLSQGGVQPHEETHDTGGSDSFTFAVAVSAGGTGGSTPAAARISLATRAKHHGFMQWAPDYLSPSNFEAVGCSSTPTANGSRTDGSDSTGRYIQISNGGGSLSGVSDGIVVAKRDWSSDANIVFKTGGAGDLPGSGQRLWVGFADGDIFGSDNPSASRHVAAFRYAPDSDGTAFWRTYTSNGAGGSTVNTTSVAVAADTRYEFEIIMGSSSVAFYINGSLVFTHTTNLPGASTGLKWKAELLADAGDKVLVGGLFLENL